MIAAGHRPTMHHAADIPGERRKLLDRENGVYEAPFAVVRRTRVPAVLVEVGVIVNPDEESWLDEAANRQRLIGALIAVLVEGHCEASPRKSRERQ